MQLIARWNEQRTWFKWLASMHQHDDMQSIISWIIPCGNPVSLSTNHINSSFTAEGPQKKRRNSHNAPWLHSGITIKSPDDSPVNSSGSPEWELEKAQQPAL